MNFESLLQGANKFGASDLHLMEGSVPYLRILGNLKRVEQPPLAHEDLQEILREVMPDRAHKQLQELKGADFSFQRDGLNRYRAVCYNFEGKLGLSMRLVPMAPFSLDELEMPEVIKQLSLVHRGMVLLTGITGSGKSTTLAAMLQYLNEHDARRVVTIEDPIEFHFEPKKCIFTQREVGNDVPNFAQGLRHALRMDPDVILIGEMRDVETIQIAIRAAETGHLVLSTLHTTGAVHTIQRILGNFEEIERDMVREQLALNLIASLTQRLVRTRDGKSRIAAQEIMVMNSSIRKMIKEDRVLDVFGVMRSRQDGMQVFDQALADLVRAKKITFEEGQKYCEDFYAFRRYIAGIKSSGDEGGVVAD